MISFLIFNSLIAALTFAAPHPATSTSILTDPTKGLFFAHKGFQLKTEGTTWLTVPTESALDTVRFSANEKDAKGSLSIRTDSVAKNASLELYARKWMRDYPSYGFEVLSAKNFTLNGQPALVVDMFSRSKNKQIRQVILKKEARVAVMTCLDDKASFSKSLQSCNRIIQSFNWK